MITGLLPVGFFRHAHEFGVGFDSQLAAVLAQASTWRDTRRPSVLSSTCHSSQVVTKTNAPIGRYQWRYSSHSSEWLPNAFGSELGRDGAAWSPLKARMFGGDIDRLKRAKNDVDEWARQGNF